MSGATICVRGRRESHSLQRGARLGGTYAVQVNKRPAMRLCFLGSGTGLLLQFIAFFLARLCLLLR